ncbi:hypothetical protein ACB098_03G075100 [Castanea mollissima]|uniref:non-specific serine/threonine protein kinase n=1 Tax=Castanea mollissima TaxID=60419 RepID=A0A8J4VHB0_9ROSI|nr:hypothetical protein CMV_018849 [Castanea mollissima]
MALSNKLPSCLFQSQKLQSLLKQLLFFFLLLLPLAMSISFNFTSFNKENITVKRDASIKPDGTIQLAEPSYFSAGRAYYNKPVPLWDNSTGRLTVTDFTTHFSFIIQPVHKEVSADGIAFFIAPFDYEFSDNHNSSGAFLGLFTNESALDVTQNQIVAVEFDTFKNTEFRDHPSDNHVGIDINSIVSNTSVTWPSSMKNGSTVYAWVSYNSKTQNLSVFLNDADNLVFGENSSVSVIVDLTTILPEWVSVGFSASTGNFTETNIICSWSFNSTLEVGLTQPNKKGGGNREKKLGLGIGLALSLGVVSCALGLLWFICWRKKAEGNAEDFDVDDHIDDEFEKGTGPRRFIYRELLHATNNFAEGGKLGEGGFGGVYKGFLSESNTVIAVKRVSKESKQGKKEYMSEVKIISRLRHRNLVQLIGWCHEQRELLLVYEYMPNGSLDSHLFGKETTLTWPMRYKIAQGLASALLYLHEEWEQCVVHRDIKSSNIMLDSNFNAKLGDFGLARLVDHELGSQTTVLAGTMGYLAPECVITGKASKESDCYSFGVVSLEIACGRKPIQPQAEPSKVSLIEWVWDLYGKGQLLEAVDKGLSMEFDAGQIERLMVVGLWCCHPDPTIRPSIRQIIQVLKFEAPLPILPSKLPVPMYFGPPMDQCKFTSTSSSLMWSKDHKQCSCSNCSTNPSLSTGPSIPLSHIGTANVELASVID